MTRLDIDPPRHCKLGGCLIDGAESVRRQFGRHRFAEVIVAFS